MRLSTGLALTSSALVLLAACGSPSGDSGGDGGDGQIVIGTSLSLSGPFGAVGSLQRQGYEAAVKLINDDGGIEVGSSKRVLKLVVQDNKSDANLAGQQARELVLKEDVTALLGPCTPPIVIPVAQVAEAQKVPLVTSCIPVGAFAEASKGKFVYSWDLFFSEVDQASSAYEAFDQVDSNKKVAIFTDTEPDGIIERGLYKSAAKSAGYEVVGDYTFPVGTTDFSGFIKDATKNGAEVVVSQTIPPDGIALWKQMKALGLKPKAAFSAKAATSNAWWDALGETAEGTLTEGFWAPTMGGTLTNEIAATLGTKIDALPDMGLAVTAMTAAQVLTDAISAAGSTDPDEINAAIEKIDGDYPIGPVKFGDDHTSKTPHLILQWSKGDAAQVVPKTDVAVQPASGIQ